MSDLGWKNFDRRLMQNRHIMEMLQKFYFDRLYKIYIVNANFLFRIMLKIVKCIISDEIFEKVYI